MRIGTRFLAVTLCSWILILGSIPADADPGGSRWSRLKDRVGMGGNDDETPGYQPPTDVWTAYFLDDDGEASPLELPMEQNDDKDWMGLHFTEYYGPKFRISVMPVDNRVTGMWRDRVPVGGLEELLTTGLVRTNRFEVIERKALGAIITEQDFGESGRVSQVTAAGVGKIQGAQFQIFATINEWTPEAQKTGGSSNYFGNIGVGAGKTTAEVGISVRLIDVTSGQVVESFTERARAGTWGIRGSTGYGDLDFNNNSPVNYAVQSCLNKAIYRTVMALNERPWRGSVVKVDQDRVFINAGSKDGMERGMVMSALALGEDLIDPETGLSLGQDSEVIGSLQITTVQEKFSVGTIIQGCEGLATGDRVELQDGP